MTCTTSRFGLFCHKRVNQELLVQDSKCSRHQDHHHRLSPMCRTKQTFPTLNLNKWSSRNDHRSTSVGHVAKREQDLGNPKSHKKVINRDRNRDDNMSDGLLPEPSKVTHIYERTQRRDYCSSMLVHSGKLYSTKRARSSDGNIVNTDQKRRKLDDEDPMASMRVDDDSRSSPPVSYCDFQDPTEDIPIPERNTNTIVLTRRQSQTESLRLSFLGGHWRLPETSQSFLLLLDKRLRVMFVSENVSYHLGHQQADMIGRSIGHFVHSKDLSAILRLANDGPLQSDDKSNSQFMVTPKTLCMTMRFCFQRPESSSQESGYTQVRCDITVRLRKKGQGVRVQDLLILCRPVRTDSILDMPTNKTTLIICHDLSFDFIICDFRLVHLMRREMGDLLHLTCKQCNKTLISTGTFNSVSRRYDFWDCLMSQANIVYNSRQNPQCNHYCTSCEDSKQTISQKKDSAAMRGSVVIWVTKLPLMDLEIFNFFTKGNNNKPEMTTSDLFLDHLLGSSHLQIISFAPSKHQRHIPKRFYMKACTSPTKTLGTMVPDVFRNIHHKLANIRICDCSGHSIKKVSVNLDEDCSSSSTLSSKNQMDVDTGFHNVDDILKSTISMSNRNVGNHRALDMHTEKVHHPHLVLPASVTTCTNCFSQLSDFSGILNQRILKDNFSDQQHMILDASGKSHMSNDSKPSCESVADNTPLEASAGNEIDIISRKERANDAQLRKSFQAWHIQSSTKSVADYKRKYFSDLSQNMPSKYSSTHGNILHTSANECQNEINWNITGHCISDMSSILSSNKLASILQTGSRPTSPLISKKNNDLESAHNGPDTSSHDAISNSEIFTNDIETTSATSKTVCSLESLSVEISQSSPPNISINSSSISKLISSAHNWPLPSLTSQILSSSAPSLASDYCTPTSNNHSQNEVKIDNISSLTESKVTQPENVNKVDNISSKMTNKKSDPFLSQASFGDLNIHTGADIYEDLTSVTSPLLSCMTSQHAAIKGQIKQSHFRHQPSYRDCNSCMDSTESTSQASFVSEDLTELDSFLNTIPLSPCLTISLSNTINTQSTAFSEWPESDTFSSPGSVSTDSSDSESSIRPSLLRTLLDKEGSVIHGPQTYTEWTLEQISKKNRDIKKVKTSSTDYRHTIHRNTRRSKNTIRKSIELPILRWTREHVMKFGRDGFQVQKPTKELPLPSSIKAVLTKQSSINLQQNIRARGFIHENDTLEEEIMIDNDLSSLEAADFSLPDDLLDMAMEYCAPLERDQTEALISDLNDFCSWEDNLYSLLEKSAQEKSVNASSYQNTQHQSESVSTSDLLFNFSQSKEILGTSPISSSMSAVLSLQTERQSMEDNAEKKLLYAQSSFSTQTSLSQSLLKSPQPSPYDLNVGPTDSINRNSKMSLLRAAITSPDVDKFIEQIPLGKAKKHKCSLQLASGNPENDPDIVITKVTGLQKSQALQSALISHDRSNKVPSAIIIRQPKKMATDKSIPSHNNSTPASDSMDSAPSEHERTTSLPIKHSSNWQIVSNRPLPAQHGNITEAPPSTKSLVIKIKVGTHLSTTKANTVNSGSLNNITKNLKSLSEHNFGGHKSCTVPRGTVNSNTDFSFTQPVSVMIARKDSHRSRRCKSIAIQTDNEPGEMYPEFEHSSTDIILYPSVSYQHVESPCHDMSPSSSSSSSHASMSELEKLLLCQSSSEDSSSSADDDYRLTANTSFLLKLLTGELSNDCYQRLDKQLLDQEKKKSAVT